MQQTCPHCELLGNRICLRDPQAQQILNKYMLDVDEGSTSVKQFRSHAEDTGKGPVGWVFFLEFQISFLKTIKCELIVKECMTFEK